MKNIDVYLFGLISRTNASIVSGREIKTNNYHEVIKICEFYGGETGTAAIILSALDVNVKLSGNYIDKYCKKEFTKFYSQKNIDTSLIKFKVMNKKFADYVFITNDSRTVFGQFDSIIDEGKTSCKAWTIPDENSIKRAKAAGIDPYFGEETNEAVRLCNKYGVPYVTIDTPPNSTLSKYASIIVISNEYITNNSAFEKFDFDKDKILKYYLQHTDALVIITNGANDIIYGKEETIENFTPYKINAVSTLGAGDVFRAACIYALLQKWEPEKIVSFASATSAIACMRFPIYQKPPKYEEIQKFIERGNYYE